MLKALGFVFALVLIVTGLGWALKGRLPGPAAILPELLVEPRQAPTKATPFDFTYKGKGCRVRPVATYELTGLVVSHNDIESFADLYHDSTSVDTKDLCVVWGNNLEREDYLEVSFRSGSFTCYFKYPSGVRFSKRGLGNNHLITDDEAIRGRIGGIRVGDQVRIEGLLVDYQMEDWRDFWRQTSTVRNDDGCEVVYVESIEVLRQGNPIWHASFRFGRLLLLALPVLYLIVLHRSVRQPTSQS